MNTVEPPKRKTDKRTINTTTSIKNTMLKMLNDMSFERISVKELCERVGINRTTFYIHYANTEDVLIDIIDEFLKSEPATEAHKCKTHNQNGHHCPYRLCDKVHTNRQFGAIIFDEKLKSIVIDRIAALTKENYMRTLVMEHELSKSDAESIYYFQINGCLAVNKMIYMRGSADWEHTSELLVSFIQGGLDHFKR